jgi:hypothetical protein
MGSCVNGGTLRRELAGMVAGGVRLPAVACAHAGGAHVGLDYSISPGRALASVVGWDHP